MWYAMDGCYKVYLKFKRFDPNDTSLCDGSGAFVLEVEYEEFKDKYEAEPDVRISSTTLAHADISHPLRNID